jgi:hypothetical protein
MPPRQSSSRQRLAAEAQLTAALHRFGLSTAGVQQALRGAIVLSPVDRAAIARILAGFASLPTHAAFEIFDYPGEYPLKKAGEAEVGRE